MRVQARMYVQGTHVADHGMIQLTVVEQKAPDTQDQARVSGHLIVPEEFARAALAREITVTMEVEAVL